MRRPQSFQQESISVAFMIRQMRETVGVEIDLVNSEVNPDRREVTESNLHRPGLALAGYVDLFTHQRIQILGNTENQYLDHLDSPERREAFNNLVQFPVPCVIVTDGNELDEALVAMATNEGIPVYRSPVPTVRFMSLLRGFLSDQFAPQRAVHGSLVDVYGIGLLLIGKSGIGKSEVALDLVERGHRLVADDVVIATKREESILMGAGTELVQHFMEVRGLGLVDIRSMFGIRAIRFQKRIEVVVNMQLWDSDEEYTRINMVEDTHDILGVDLPMVQVPITPGKNITVICEVIAMNYLLRHYGYDPAEVFTERLRQRIQQEGAPTPRRGIEYFEQDYE
ncbi:HPr kinase/phosphorylase [Salinibacter sp. 10B]|uniref:HPr(Ser) kinase/phosphatase n=1 Tax=Salinibacter sp. 10B TaxID=1923971 RepID=UPI000CF372B3|nr:HPr(Ser) kinase/phosphatase [Salinibacter sp. 10B]PQJ33725.1 HPr kinase/phosphorylase [Salinibacter sp. 10B]